MTVTLDDTNLKAIADAIRAKNGTEETYEPSEMADAITAIESLNYDKMISRSITEVSSNVTEVGSYTFYSCNMLATADFPKAVEVGDYAFYGTSALKNINFPLVRSVGRYTFRGAGFENAYFPAVTSALASSFAYNTSLKTANFPKLTETGGSMFSSCSALESVDLPKATTIGTYSFEKCYSLKAVILRSTTACELDNTSAFSNCYHYLGTTNATYNPNGLKDGYIYVPSALVNTYKAATNWSTYATQFRALESYTVDGTTTGALDESKI